MAEEQITYSVVIDTDVKGEDKLEKTQQTVEETGDSFNTLQRQIRDTKKALQEAAAAGDKARFNQLKDQLNDLNDELEAVQTSSKEFKDQLSELPGAAGAAGSAIGGVEKQFKLLAANPILIVITAIVGAFMALRESLQRTEEGQAKLAKISEGFSKILNGLFAIIEPLAMTIADLVIAFMENETVMKVLSTTAGVLSASFRVILAVGKALYDLVVNNLINAFTALTGVASGVGKVLKGVFTFDLDLIKEGVEGVKSAVVAGFNATVENIKATANAIVDGVVDGVTNGFDAGVTAFKTGYARLSAEQKKALEEQRAFNETMRRLNADLKAVDMQGQTEIKSFTEETNKAILEGLKRNLLERVNITKYANDQMLQAQRIASQQSLEIRAAELAEKDAINQAELNIAAGFGNLLQQIAGKNKKLAIAGVIVEQAANIAKIISNTAAANAKSVAASPLTAGQPWVGINTATAALSIASSIAAASKAIQQINATEGAAVGGGSGAGMTAMSANIPTPSTGRAAVPQMQGSAIGGESATSQIANTIRGAIQPVRAYVVGNDISTQQQLDRRLGAAATMGG